MGMIMNNLIKIRSSILTASVIFLSGCPGSGDRLKADETTTVSKVGAEVCFDIPDASDYQPSLIAINPRGTPPQKLSIKDSPDLTVANGKLCLPPTFYQFSEKRQYIVQYILQKPDDQQSQRSVVIGVEFTGDDVETFTLNANETTR
jgi:hypothetical protein